MADRPLLLLGGAAVVAAGLYGLHKHRNGDLDARFQAYHDSKNMTVSTPKSHPTILQEPLASAVPYSANITFSSAPNSTTSPAILLLSQDHGLSLDNGTSYLPGGSNLIIPGQGVLVLAITGLVLSFLAAVIFNITVWLVERRVHSATSERVEDAERRAEAAERRAEEAEGSAEEAVRWIDDAALIKEKYIASLAYITVLEKQRQTPDDLNTQQISLASTKAYTKDVITRADLTADKKAAPTERHIIHVKDIPVEVTEALLVMWFETLAGPIPRRPLIQPEDVVGKYGAIIYFESPESCAEAMKLNRTRLQVELLFQKREKKEAMHEAAREHKLDISKVYTTFDVQPDVQEDNITDVVQKLDQAEMSPAPIPQITVQSPTADEGTTAETSTKLLVTPSQPVMLSANEFEVPVDDNDFDPYTSDAEPRDQSTQASETSDSDHSLKSSSIGGQIISLSAAEVSDAGLQSTPKPISTTSSVDSDQVRVMDTEIEEVKEEEQRKEEVSDAPADESNAELQSTAESVCVSSSADSEEVQTVDTVVHEVHEEDECREEIANAPAKDLRKSEEEREEELEEEVHSTTPSVPSTEVQPAVAEASTERSHAPVEEVATEVQTTSPTIEAAPTAIPNLSGRASFCARHTRAVETVDPCSHYEIQRNCAEPARAPSCPASSQNSATSCRSTALTMGTAFCTEWRRTSATTIRGRLEQQNTYTRNARR